MREAQMTVSRPLWKHLNFFFFLNPVVGPNVLLPTTSMLFSKLTPSIFLLHFGLMRMALIYLRLDLLCSKAGFELLQTILASFLCCTSVPVSTWRARLAGWIRCLHIGGLAFQYSSSARL